MICYAYFVCNYKFNFMVAALLNIYLFCFPNGFEGIKIFDIENIVQVFIWSNSFLLAWKL